MLGKSYQGFFNGFFNGFYNGFFSSLPNDFRIELAVVCGELPTTSRGLEARFDLCRFKFQFCFCRCP